MKYSGRIGLTLVVLAIWLMFYVDNNKNDTVWYWREYTAVGKHITPRTHKGRDYNDYYIEEKYTDDPKYVYSVQVWEYNYDNAKIGQVYYKRDTHDGIYNGLHWLVLIMLGASCLLLASSFIRHNPL